MKIVMYVLGAVHRDKASRVDTLLRVAIKYRERGDKSVKVVHARISCALVLSLILYRETNRCSFKHFILFV